MSIIPTGLDWLAAYTPIGDWSIFQYITVNGPRAWTIPLVIFCTTLLYSAFRVSEQQSDIHHKELQDYKSKLAVYENQQPEYQLELLDSILDTAECNCHCIALIDIKFIPRNPWTGILTTVYVEKTSVIYGFDYEGRYTPARKGENFSGHRSYKSKQFDDQIKLDAPFQILQFVFKMSNAELKEALTYKPPKIDLKFVISYLTDRKSVKLPIDQTVNLVLTEELKQRLRVIEGE